jgi:peptidoglycan DL-endopeptidase CwlO
MEAAPKLLKPPRFTSQKIAESSLFASVPRFVGRLGRLRARLLAAAACAALFGISAAAGGADGTSLQRKATQLRNANETLAQRTHRSLLELYSLDAQLKHAQARVTALTAEAARVRAERASLRRQMHAARSTVLVSQQQLASRLRTLYEQNDVDALAAVLGAASLDEAVTSLDDLNRSAELNRRITRQARHARTMLKRLAAKLAARDARLRALTAEAERTLSSLGAQRAARTAYIADLRAQQRLNGAEIARIGSVASAAAAHVPATPAPTAAAPAVAQTAAPAGSTLTVVATGYSMSGSTSTGIPVGWGVAAVDPGFIPLGTHMTIPGYGVAVAADTGSAVRGAVIDLWFPSEAQALAWGRRTVSITLQ